MKRIQAKNRSAILQRITSIEKEVSDLKLSVLNETSPSQKKLVSLRGILKGVDITEKEIDAAKKSLSSAREI